MAAKNILQKIALLGCILVVLNFIYTAFFWKKDLDKEADMLLELLNKQDSCDILYFGESSNFRADTFDVSKKSISEFTAEYFKGIRLGAVDRPAMHGGIYLQVMKHLHRDAKVKTLVVTLNLRSFDATWIHSNLETALQKSNVMYQLRPPLMNRFLLALNCYEKKTADERTADMKEQWSRDTLRFPYPFPYKTVVEWDQAVGNGGFLNPDGSWDMPRIGLATSYIKTYGFQIDTLKNPRIRDFDAMVSLAREKGLHLVFTLMAENVQYADSLVGKDLVFLMQQNRKLLVDRYTKKGVMVVDNFELVNGRDYIDQNWTTEHYKERGRRAIARNLAGQLKKLYPANYREALTPGN